MIESSHDYNLTLSVVILRQNCLPVSKICDDKIVNQDHLMSEALTCGCSRGVGAKEGGSNIIWRRAAVLFLDLMSYY